MNRNELQADILRRTEHMRSIAGDLTKADEFNKEKDELRTMGEMMKAMDDAEARALETRTAMEKVPAPPAIGDKAGWDGVRSQILKAIETGKRSSIDLSGIEHRANVQILSGGAGSNTAPGIIRAMVDGGKLRSKCSLFLGKNSITTVPVFAPTAALPVKSVAGAIATAADSTATLAGTSLTLNPWYNILQVSMGALLSTDIESEMPAIMADNFAGAIDRLICQGASTSAGLGVFIADAAGVTTSQDITMTTSASAPLFKDYIGMALTLLGLTGNPDGLAIVVHPSIFAVALGDATAGNDAMKMEFLTKGTILGIPVVLSSYALTTLTAGSYVAVGGQFKHYALAIAQELVIDQIKTVGTDGVTFQAFMYMTGQPLVGSSFRRLKTGA